MSHIQKGHCQYFHRIPSQHIHPPLTPVEKAGHFPIYSKCHSKDTGNTGNSPGSGLLCYFNCNSAFPQTVPHTKNSSQKHPIIDIQRSRQLPGENLWKTSGVRLEFRIFEEPFMENPILSFKSKAHPPIHIFTRCNISIALTSLKTNCISCPRDLSDAASQHLPTAASFAG